MRTDGSMGVQYERTIMYLNCNALNISALLTQSAEPLQVYKYR